MNVQEQLCSYVMRTHGRTLSGPERARAWTYLYRHWRDEDGRRSAECVGVLVERDNGTVLRVNVADILPPEFSA